MGNTDLLNFSGVPSTLYDVSNPDWIPSVNMGHQCVTAAGQEGCQQHERRKKGPKRKIEGKNNYGCPRLKIYMTDRKEREKSVDNIMYLIKLSNGSNVAYVVKALMKAGILLDKVTKHYNYSFRPCCL